MILSSRKPLPASLKIFRDAPASEMVVLPRGQFVMGMAHDVRIGYDMAIARYCVTFEEYDAYAKATGAPLPADEGWGRGNMPVVNVTWEDARRYANSLANITGKPYRLPSEAEWEYAARAGTTTDYWWGNVPDIATANFIDTPGGGPFSVNSLEPNPWGLYNMNGNVDEWVEDCFHESYFGAPADGSAWTTDYRWTNPARDWVRVLRGGNYLSAADEIRSSYRGRVDSSYSGAYVGFRVALTLANP
jgi:formylglycine-generating enzyme required for sulfatase activity